MAIYGCFWPLMLCQAAFPRSYDGSEPLEDFLTAGPSDKSPAPVAAVGPEEAPGELIKNMLQ